jgi:hypothetical protein
MIAKIKIAKQLITSNHKNSSGIILPVSAFANEKLETDKKARAKKIIVFFFMNFSNYLS